MSATLLFAERIVPRYTSYTAEGAVVLVSSGHT